MEVQGARALLAQRGAEHLAAQVTCKEQRFDQYDLALTAAAAAREEQLRLIEVEVQAGLDGRPQRGQEGARCEKAMSNGTFRPARGQAAGTCAEGLCCGAQRIQVEGGQALMTVETCRPEAATEAPWRAPRGPMDLQAPAAVTYPWTCIQGARPLLAGGAAALASLWLLA